VRKIIRPSSKRKEKKERVKTQEGLPDSVRGKRRRQGDMPFGKGRGQRKVK
jgi:hypothetical protein